MEVTEWYPAEIKPVYVGVYKVKGTQKWSTGKTFYSYWTGIEWKAAHITPQVAVQICTKAEFQAKEWRGLTEPHHGS